MRSLLVDPVFGLQFTVGSQYFIVTEPRTHIVSLYRTGASTLGKGFVSYQVVSSTKIRFRTECVFQR